MQKFKAVCLDIDGTLVDSIEVCLSLFVQAIEDKAEFTLTAQQVVEHFGINEEGVIRALVPASQADETVEHYYAIYDEALKQGRIKAFDGALELVQALYDKGVPLFLITGKGKRTCDMTLEHFGIYHYFKAVRCGGLEQINKAQYMREFIEAYDLKPEEICYVGDAVSDFTASTEVGAPCLSAMWQSNDAQSGVAYLKEHNPGRCFESLKECAAFLLAHT